MPAAYNIRVRIRWWVLPYLWLCQGIVLCGILVDLERVHSIVRRGVSIGSRSAGPSRASPDCG